MTRLFSIVLSFFFTSAIFGQNQKSIEISLIGRTDIHGKYESNFAGRAYNDTNRISGFSYGVNAIFRRKISKSYSLSLGIGYYRLKVDKIRGNLPGCISNCRTKSLNLVN